MLKRLHAALAGACLLFGASCAAAPLSIAGPTLATGWTRIAPEGSTVAATVPVEVRYGSGNKWAATRTIDAGTTLACSNVTFGDPAKNIVKECDARLVAVASAPVPPVVASAPPSAATHLVGVNLSGGHENGGLFLNRFKGLSGGPIWAANVDGQSFTLNADGYPTSIPAGGLHTAMLFVDPPAWGGPLTYRMRWSKPMTWHTGSVNTGQVQITGPNEALVTFRPDGFGDDHINFFQMVIDSAPGELGGFSLVRTDQVAMYDAGQQVSPELVTLLSPLRGGARAMDWMAANSLSPTGSTTWANRRAPSAISWLETDEPGKTPIPIEALIEIANRTGQDPWINVPADADDDYVRQLATTTKALLSPLLKLQVELSNEVWNGSFPQNAYFAAKAKVWVPKLANGSWDEAKAQGYRQAQVMAIFRQVYGADFASRVEGVFGGWTAAPDRLDYVVSGFNAAGAGSLADLGMKSNAVTFYIGHSIPGDPVFNAMVARGDLDAFFAALQDGTGLIDKGYNLANLPAIYAAHVAAGKKYGLGLTAYEGGLHTPTFANTDMAAVATAEAFVAKAIADPRIGTIYTKALDQFFAAGGTRAMVYNLMGSQSYVRWGPWGVVADVRNQSSTPRWSAMVAESGR